MKTISKTRYFNPTIVTIVGGLLFIATLVMQGQVNRRLPIEAQGGINGIISQIQVLISVAMVVMIPKKGYTISLIMCIFNSLYILIFGVLLSHNPGAAPGVLSPLITIVVCTLIHYYSLMSYKAQEELERRNSELVDKNDKINKESEELSRIVYNDQLTGLFNKDKFKNHITDVLSEEDITPFTIVYTEINDFASISEKYDNETSDMVLTTFGYRLHNFCGNSSITARIEGAKFALIITGQRNREAVTSYLSDLVAEVCEPITANGKQIEISVSSGIAHYPRDGRTAESLMDSADKAVQHACEKGKGSVYFFS